PRDRQGFHSMARLRREPSSFPQSAGIMAGLRQNVNGWRLGRGGPLWGVRRGNMGKAVRRQARSGGRPTFPRWTRQTAPSAAAPGYSSWPLRNGYTGVTSNQVPHSSETMMRFYNQQHRFYCGVDLHARTLSLHILDAAGKTVLAKTIAATPDAFLAAVAPFRDGLAVAAECMFAWYWLADLCTEQHIPFVLGHALYMKAIHGGKAKTDPIDAHKIAVLLRGGMLPQAYVYPKGMRETRDLLRRRTFLVRKRAEALVHLTNTNSQYNLPP